MQKATEGNNKSSISRSRLNMNDSHTSPQRNRFSQQSVIDMLKCRFDNLKYFFKSQIQIEIDHQIAKCLDTLDRQGLKFLKQTLKTSNIFNSTNLEIDQKQEYGEQQQSINSIKKQVKLFQSQAELKGKPYKQDEKKSIKKDFLQQNKKAFLKNKEQSKKQIQSKYRSNSTAKLKPSSVVQIQQEKKVPQKIKTIQSQKQKKKEIPQVSSVSRVNQKQPNKNSRVVRKTVIENKKTNQKISLGQKLNKKMTELNISKVGPGKSNKSHTTQKSQSKIEPTTQNQPEQLIEEEILETNEHQIEESFQQNDSGFQSQSIIKSSIMGSYQELPQPEIKLSQKINPLKPSVKDKLNQNESILAQSKIQQSRVPEEKQNLQKSFIQKLSASIQVDHEDLKSHLTQNKFQKNLSAEMSLIVEKINKLTPQKFVQIQKYLDFIENKSIKENPIIEQFRQSGKNPQKNQKMKIQENLQNLQQVYSVNSFKKQQEIMNEEQKFKGFQKSSSYNDNQSIAIKNKILPNVPKSQSRKGMRQKKQKASMINGSMNMRSASRSRIKVDIDFEEIQKPEKNKKIQKSQIIKPYLTSRKEDKSEIQTSGKLILEKEKPLKMQKINFAQDQNYIKNESVKIKKQIANQYKNESIVKETSQNVEKNVVEIMQNNSLNIYQSQVKMLNISNKKLQVVKKAEQRTQLKFKIISNRGHPSLYGLTGIELYTIFNKRVIVGEKQLSMNSNSTSKLLYLFNGNHYTTEQQNTFQSPLSKSEIIVQLDKQNQKIGGIMIFNFNKSSIESSKQVNELQIYHNDQKMWKGSIDSGAYNQFTQYATKIQFMSGFRFPQIEINQRQLKDNCQEMIQKDKTSIWIDSKGREKSSVIQLAKQEEQKTQNKQKILYKSQNRRNNNTTNIQVQNSLAVDKNFNFNIGDNQNFERSKPKDNHEMKHRVQSIVYESKPTVQKKTINTARQQNYDQFDAMLKGLQQNINRQKSKSKLNPVTLPLENHYSSTENKQKPQIPKINYANQSESLKKQEKPKTSTNQIDDFMNDSLFEDKSYSRILAIKRKIQPKRVEEKQALNFNKKDEQPEKKNKDINIDDFLGELEDVMKNKQSGNNKKINKIDKRIQIPKLPTGKIIQIEIYQNWGHQAYVGLQAIEFFDKDGQQFLPYQILCNKNLNNANLLESLTSKNIINRDEKIQTKLGFQKSSSTVLKFNFPQQKTFSLIRIWNYNGHRVHSNIGIRQCMIKIDGKQVFLGQFKKNQSTPQNWYKNFQVILFTNDQQILKKIKQNDWLTELKNKIKEEKNLFKSTLLNFNRPKTKNNDMKGQLKQNSVQPIKTASKQVKLPKRACWQYEPPQLPEGNILIFLLHDTWGDKNFIGLNGIEIFDESGRMLKREQISKIRAFPGTTGQNSDKRVIENVINGVNYTNLDSNIWLATFQSDIQKLQTGKPNSIIIQLYKQTKISGINIYNYSKTPERGVREIQIKINNLLAFRGYVKIFNESLEQNSVHTTINFTKNIQVLEKMNYEGYNQDNIDQNVAFVNQRKTVKA